MYDIKQADGTIAAATPIEGKWYCHFEIVGNDGDEKFHRDSQLAKFVGGSFVDEEGEDVSMVSDYWPDYIVEQV